MVKRDETLTFQSSRYGKKEKMVSIDKVKEWLKSHDMTKHIGVIYSGVCSITFPPATIPQRTICGLFAMPAWLLVISR